MQDGIIRGNNRKIIRVTPTLDTSEYAVGDVLFNSVAIPNAVISNGGCSKLVAMFVLNQSVSDIDVDFIFSENSLTLGTQNATANIADADMEAGNIIGFLHLDSNIGTTQGLDNSEIKRVHDTGAGDSGGSIATPVLLQAAAGSTNVYIAATTGTVATHQADAIDLIFHIEY